MSTIEPNIVSGRQLRAARVLAGLTQSQLSIAAGFSRRAAKYWESRGNALPTTVPSTLQAIEAALRCYGVELFVDPSPGCRLVVEQTGKNANMPRWHNSGIIQQWATDGRAVIRRLAC